MGWYYVPQGVSVVMKRPQHRAWPAVGDGIVILFCSSVTKALFYQFPTSPRRMGLLRAAIELSLWFYLKQTLVLP